MSKRAEPITEQGGSRQYPGKVRRSVAPGRLQVLKRLLGEAAEGPNRKFLIASIVVHLIVITAFFISWDSEEKIEPLIVPKHIQARVLSEQELAKLNHKKVIEQQKIAQKKQAELKKKQRLERKKKQAEAKKREAALKKKREAEKKRLAIAKKKEQAKLKAEKLKKQQRLEKERLAKKAAEQKRLKELDLKKAEQAKQKLAENARQAQENALLNKIKQIEDAKKLKAKQEALRAEELLAVSQQQAYEATEVQRFMSLIRSKIEGRWRIPPKSQGLSVTLRLALLPTGELVSVSVTKSSGNSAFDRSAEHAATSIATYPVPSDSLIFNRNFRYFQMRFVPSS